MEESNKSLFMNEIIFPYLFLGIAYLEKIAFTGTTFADRTLSSASISARNSIISVPFVKNNLGVTKVLIFSHEIILSLE